MVTKRTIKKLRFGLSVGRDPMPEETVALCDLAEAAMNAREAVDYIVQELSDRAGYRTDLRALLSHLEESEPTDE